MAGKQAIDKAAMFRKIMPSASIPQQAPADEPELPVAEAPTVADMPIELPSKVSSGTPAVEAMQMLADEPISPQLTEAAELEPPTEPPHPVNLAEVFIRDNYDFYRRRVNGCPCARCRDDTLGIALNKVTPHYVPSDRIEPGMMRERGLITEAVAALMQALFVVRRRPRHTAEDLLELQH